MRTAVLVTLSVLGGSAPAVAEELTPQSLYASVAAGRDLKEACAAADEAFDTLIAAGDTADASAWVEAALQRRTLHQLSAAQGVDARQILQFLSEAPRLHRAVALSMQPQDDPTGVYGLLDRLRQEHGAILEKMPSLAAAIAVVHDQPLARFVNENRVNAPDPVELFAFYASAEGSLAYSVREMPVPLLVYVVDSVTPVQEMHWARSTYKRDTDLGRRFFEIRYDYDHLGGRPKLVTQRGFSLPNIKRYGGVCADQAHFAVSVGKSMGIPAAYTRGRSGEVGHAWVGYLDPREQRPTWNFDSGRYEEYQGVRGVLEDPQTRTMVSDSAVSLLADLLSSTEAERSFAVALTDAAAVLGQREHPPVDKQLQLLEMALRRCPAYVPAWYQVRDLAITGAMSLDQKRYWADALMRLCSTRYPDFTAEILGAMVQTVDDVQQQNLLWERLFEQVSRQRHDLAAQVRMAQGTMWEKAGEPRRAGQCYMDIIDRYANAGPFVLDALQATELLLRQMDRLPAVIQLYADTWNRLKRPTAPAFAQASNWHQVGTRYAMLLEQIGESREAARVRVALERAGVQR